MKKDYQDERWKQFRSDVIALDGNKCARCGRTLKETVLQVHHLKYIPGRSLWDYDTKDVETLCKACHAEEHGKIRPSTGWEYCGMEDLEDLSGTCEWCNSPLRYSFEVFHPQWGTMHVGTYCCDHLTDTTIASNKHESMTRYKDRMKRFVVSKRWKTDGKDLTINHLNYSVIVRQDDNGYFLVIHNIKGKERFTTVEKAKEKAFDVVESGVLSDYMKKHNIPLPEKKKRRKDTLHED